MWEDGKREPADSVVMLQNAIEYSAVGSKDMSAKQICPVCRGRSIAHWWSVLLSRLVLLEWDAQDGIEALLPYVMPFLVTFAKKNQGRHAVCLLCHCAPKAPGGIDSIDRLQPELTGGRVL